MTVAGVIVAAGRSSRMGEPKPLLEIGDRPMLQWVVDAAEASLLDPLVVVTGYGAAEVEAGIRLSRARWARNADPGRGTMSSLRMGVAATGGAAAVVKVVGDQPELSPHAIDAVIAARDPERFDVVLADYCDGTGHPLLVEWAPLQAVIGRDGDRLLWQLMEANPARVCRVAVDTEKPIDVNTASDVLQVRARLGAGG